MEFDTKAAGLGSGLDLVFKSVVFAGNAIDVMLTYVDNSSLYLDILFILLAIFPIRGHSREFHLEGPIWGGQTSGRRPRAEVEKFLVNFALKWCILVQN